MFTANESNGRDFISLLLFRETQSYRTLNRLPNVYPHSMRTHEMRLTPSPTPPRSHPTSHL